MEHAGDSLPYITGLVLLLPGILVLGLRSTLIRWAERGRPPIQEAGGDAGRMDLNSLLIPVCLMSWLVTFLILWYVSSYTDGTTLAIFDRELRFRPFVPFFGLLGAMVFVIDLFRGKKAAGFGTEFALRLVLGPYVAIVMVVLFEDNFTFVQLSGPKAQAALSFFSGFLVVLFLQGITERGNELLGRWREEARYEPSEIAAKFKLNMRDDLRLRQEGNLKYLGQLRNLPDSVVKEKGKEAGLGEGLLLEFKRQLEVERLEGTLGNEAWKKLGNEGLKNAKDIVALTQKRLEEVSEKQSVSRDALEGLRKDYQAMVASWNSAVRT